MESLNGRTVLITGASAGIGAATARLFARHGAKLVLNARREDRLTEIARETGGAAVAGDVCDPAVRARLLEAAGSRVEILVNNAGYAQPGPVEQVDEDEARRQLEVNVLAPAALARAVLPAMRSARTGRIVNVSSIAGRFGYPLLGWYCASKHAVEGLSDALRLEVAPFGVHVVLIEPGPVETEFFDVTKKSGARILGDAASPYRTLFENTAAIEGEMRKHAVPAEAVAQAILEASTAPRPRARYAVSAMAVSSLLAVRFLPRSWFDYAVRKQFRVPRRMG